MKIRIIKPGSFLAEGLVVIGLFGMCFLVSVVFLHGCVSPRSEPITPTEPGPVAAIAGDFVVYKVANGKVKDFDKNMIIYRVGELQFNPSIADSDTAMETYNRQFAGDGSDWLEQSIFYQEDPGDMGEDFDRGASDHPEAIVLNNKLCFYYTNKADFDDTADSCGTADDSWGNDAIGDDPGSAELLPSSSFPNCHIIGGIQNGDVAHTASGKKDIDWYKFHASAGTTFHARVLANQYRSYYCVLATSDDDICKRPMRLSLYKNPPPAEPLVTSRYGMDFYQFDDPELGAVLGTGLLPGDSALLPGDTATYYLQVEDISTLLPFPDNTAFKYILAFDGTPGTPANPAVYETESRSYIYKAEIQPARSGNPKLDGGKIFAPDDVSTVVEDIWPDCDGIPGTGDEGDWGIQEICYHSASDNIGYQDGVMQYWEVDDLSAIDDGEWFKGEKTNIPTWEGDEAPTVIRLGNKLLMWLNIGGTIYQAQSTDGLTGLNWDLSNIYNDRATLRPRSQDDSKAGDPSAPVVSSGVYGFCDTSPDGDDVQTVNKGLLKKGLLGYIGYPHTIGVSPGSDGILNTFPQADEYNAGGDKITSGNDGIINTFFIPSSFQYCPPYYLTLTGFNAPDALPPGETSMLLKDLWDPMFKGPGNPDSFAAGPTCILGSSTYDAYYDRHAYLLGDDEWDPSLTLTPAEYWRKQRCNLFTLAEQFHRCAMGVPDTEAIQEGGDGRLDTVEKILGQNNDSLCHEGNKVGICRGADNQFGIDVLERPLLGDDEYCIQTDPELTIAAGHTVEVVAICPGPNNHLETIPIDGDTSTPLVLDPFDTAVNPIPGLYMHNPSDWITVHDVLCGDSCDYSHTTMNRCYICPGDDGDTLHPRLDSAWSLYYANPPDELADEVWRNKLNWYSPTGTVRYYYKGDLYSAFDDGLCIINNKIALCPGPNGYFQAYPLHTRKVIDHWDDYEELMDDYNGTPDDCQELTAVETWDEFYETEKLEYFLYQYKGVLFDDAIIRRDGKYIITTGANGINQSCAEENDYEQIRRFRGKPDQPIIRLGDVNVRPNTFPLRDDKNYIELENDFDVPRIDTGPDGIANTFALGDDRVEIYLGTARPDMPCILAGDNGIADTDAEGNDTQLYEVGEKTGFDTYLLATPEVVREGDKLYLYYAGLGWMNEPQMRRPDRGSYNNKGECQRPGLDGYWGDNSYEYKFGNNGFIDSKERSFFNGAGYNNPEFWFSLNNRQGVLLTSRIGVATADVDCVASSVSPGNCWTRRNRPVIDVGQQCANFSDSLIPGLEGLIPGANKNCFNYRGSYSPDVWIEYEESDDQPIFHMMLTGFNSDLGPDDDPGKCTGQYVDEAQIGLARSLDGVHWDVAYNLNPVVNTGAVMMLEAVKDAENANFANSTLVRAGDDSFGMLMLQYQRSGRGVINTEKGNLYRRPHGKEWMVYGVRKGLYYVGCALEISAPENTAMAHRVPGIMSALIMIVPFIFFLGMKLLRRKAHT